MAVRRVPEDRCLADVSNVYLRSCKDVTEAGSDGRPYALIVAS